MERAKTKNKKINRCKGFLRLGGVIIALGNSSGFSGLTYFAMTSLVKFVGGGRVLQLSLSLPASGLMFLYIFSTRGVATIKGLPDLFSEKSDKYKNSSSFLKLLRFLGWCLGVVAAVILGSQSYVGILSFKDSNLENVNWYWPPAITGGFCTILTSYFYNVPNVVEHFNDFGKATLRLFYSRSEIINDEEKHDQPILDRDRDYQTFTSD